MKKTLGRLAAVMMMFFLIMITGCARQDMNDSMGTSIDTMSEEKKDPGKGTMQEDAMPGSMEKMPENAMEKNMK